MTFPGNPLPYAPPQGQVPQPQFAVPPNGVYPPVGVYAQPAPDKKKPNAGLLIVAVAAIAAAAFVMLGGSTSGDSGQAARYDQSAKEELADGDVIAARYYTALAQCIRAHGESGSEKDACEATATERMKKARSDKGDAERAAERARIKSKYGS